MFCASEICFLAIQQHESCTAVEWFDTQDTQDTQVPIKDFVFCLFVLNFFLTRLPKILEVMRWVLGFFDEKRPKWIENINIKYLIWLCSAWDGALHVFILLGWINEATSSEENNDDDGVEKIKSTLSVKRSSSHLLSNMWCCSWYSQCSISHVPAVSLYMVAGSSSNGAELCQGFHRCGIDCSTSAPLSPRQLALQPPLMLTISNLWLRASVSSAFHWKTQCFLTSRLPFIPFA